MKPDKDMVTRIEDVSKKLKEDPNGQYDDEAAELDAIVSELAASVAKIGCHGAGKIPR